ncbi:RING finger protein 223 [Echeneis naucrates]|uniref:RING finger protein 223-like n=1 Tax=Echeneis naucrates TaxID=173247 RepID=A0A665UDS9_ECHNA|nr:RING finger protein 223-like [Echeneis naucrates]
MCSEFECGICYWTYDAGRRCPRELLCEHSFCESCLLALSRAPGAEEPSPGAGLAIVCPLCRQITPISAEGKMRAELRVDETVLERLWAAGLLDREEALPDTQAQDRDRDRDRDPSGRSAARKLGLSWKKIWRIISGKSSNNRENCMDRDDLRNFTLMACYMF